MEELIRSLFKVRYCGKFVESKNKICICGKLENDHGDFFNIENAVNLPNNIIEKECDTYGNIRFIGYENPPLKNRTKYLRFYCENQPNMEESVYRLLTTYWSIPKPRLIISVNGGFKRMNFRKNQQKKNFKQGLIEVMKRDTTWIIGGGFHVGIHKLVGEAVHDYHLLHDENESQVKLIGVSTWGVVLDNFSLSKSTAIYEYNNRVEKGKVTLDPNYDAFLFCDDGTERQYDKEIEFRLKFEKYVQNKASAFAVQILYEGGSRALEYAYNLLIKDVPLVVIKSSGRAADIICETLNVSESNRATDITKIINEYKSQLRLSESDIPKYYDYLYKISLNYKTQIVVHDILDSNMKLEKDILEAIISRDKKRDLERILELTIRFNSHDIAEAEVFQNPKFFLLEQKVLVKHFIVILKMNRFEFVELFLENITNIEELITEDVLIELYQTSLSGVKCRCIELLNDLIVMEDKSFSKDGRDFNKKILPVIYKIIHTLSNNVLKQKFTDKEFMKNNIGLSIRDLYLWSVLCGHFEMALIFWRVGKDHISSALIGSIILNRMRSMISKRGFSDLSETLSAVSRKFQDMAIQIINEAYNKDQLKAYSLLIRVLHRWDKTTCVQLAIRGNLLDFLNQSPCRSHIREAWMGELSPFLPTWKVLLTIPFSPLLIKPFIIPSLSQKKVRRNSDTETKHDQTDTPLIKQFSVEYRHITFKDGIVKFYQTPIVKFIIYLVSYVIFLLTFAYVNLTELKEITKGSDMIAEIFVYVYVIAITAEEIRQANDCERSGFLNKVKNYMSGSWNAYDSFVIILFCTALILRFSLHNDHFTIVRCFFAVCFSMFCLRSMQFYFIIPTIGPKVIMIRKMIVDILFFLSIFSLFIISYGTLAHSLLNPNSEWDLSLIKEVFYYPYFQTYGELMLDNFNITSPCDHMCVVKYITIIGGFAIFLLLTNILLINLLIAMFGHTFNKIQDESEKHFYFIQMQLLSEFQRKPLLPPPLNMLYFVGISIKMLFSKIHHKKSRRKGSCMSRDLSDEENIQLIGFEQLCMESSALKTYSQQNMRESKTESPLDTMMEFMKKLNCQK